jgi:hypothetical protein
MAPLGAGAAVLLFLFLRERLGDPRRALALALIFAFATPTLFRAAFLNQNAIVAHLVFGGWILKAGLSPRPPAAAPGTRALLGIGLLLGFAIVCDYSAIQFAIVFGCWILLDAWRRGGAAVALREGAIYSAGAAISLCILLAYQWVAFGHPIWPAQRYMPPTEYSVRGWFGFTAPTAELMWGNLFDLRYGLFAFCPLLLAAVAAPFIRKTGDWMPVAQRTRLDRTRVRRPAGVQQRQSVRQPAVEHGREVHGARRAPALPCLGSGAAGDAAVRALGARGRFAGDLARGDHDARGRAHGHSTRCR